MNSNNQTTKSYSDMKKHIDRSILQIDEKLKKCPEGDLRIWKHRNGFQYCISYMSENGKRIRKNLSSKNKDTLYAYGLKLYLQKVRVTLVRESSALKYLSKIDFDEKGKIYDTLPPEIQSNVKPLYTSVQHDIAAWYASPFQHNSYPLDSTIIYETINKERVRSRAECIIANELLNAGLMYHYEELLILQNGKQRFPDFKIAHPKTGQFYYLEFFGMMDTPDYAENAFKRIAEYTNDPISPNMIFIFDSKTVPFTNVTIKNIIHHYFLA